MIGMLVRDQDRGNIFDTLAETLQPLERLTAREAGIDQNARGAAGHERAVATTAARQHRNRHCHMPLAYPHRLWKRRILAARHL